MIAIEELKFNDRIATIINKMIEIKAQDEQNPDEKKQYIVEQAGRQKKQKVFDLLLKSAIRKVEKETLVPIMDLDKLSDE